MDNNKFLLRSNKYKLALFLLLFFIGTKRLYSQTAIGIAPGEYIQISRAPIISILPITNVTISILGEDSLYVAGTVDSFTIIEGTLRIKTYYTLHVSMTAPIRNLSIQVLLSYNADNILKQNIFEDFLIDTGVQPNIIANFSADQTEGSAPLKVSFNNESTGYIIGYYWDFGDETTSSKENPQHTYLEPGTYSVSLTVFNFNVQNQITKQDFINVQYVTSLENDEPIKPHDIDLGQNYPNPFNASTTINYTLRKANNVRLSVFDINGREIKTLVSQVQSAGQYSVSFDASNLASGIYIYKFESGFFEKSRRMILVR
jgi:PKD repeat protein